MPNCLVTELNTLQPFNSLFSVSVRQWKSLWFRPTSHTDQLQ